MGHELIRHLVENTFPSPHAAAAAAPGARQNGPYLRIHALAVFVRNIEQSLRFYVDQLGFRALTDSTDELGRCVTVAPPDGTSILALICPKPGDEEYVLVGKGRFTVFVSDDIPAKFAEWKSRGVRFSHPPQREDWGGIVTGFEDVDGNRFALVGFDPANREIRAQRRAAQELEAARQVQAKLFPRVSPSLATLDCAAACVQARHVGGDYYDFLDLGRGRLGLLVADVCGKGMPAALLMSNLQAHVRNLCATYSYRPFVPIAIEQPARFLQTLNRLFFETTTDEAYATLLFIEYDEDQRRIRYANCGHLAGLILRRDDSVERLPSTCGVLGLFRNFDCVTEERQLAPGDTLCLYTDGLTESFNHAGEEFGEERLIESLRRHAQSSPEALVRLAVEQVQAFTSGEQHDDITLIVAKCQ